MVRIVAIPLEQPFVTYGYRNLLTSDPRWNILLHVSDETRAELKRLREVSDATARAIEEAIRKAKSENGSLREIADIIGLSHTEVRRILNKKTGAS